MPSTNTNDLNIGKKTRENCDRFKQEIVASKYPSEYRENHKRDQREKKAILRCLERVPAKCHILDFPCGTGRLIKLLQKQDFKISAADGSQAMLDLAKENTQSNAENPISFYLGDVFDSSFEDQEFEAVICNRLFHHFNKSEDRKRALTELSRISKGPIIISFFNSFSLSMSLKRLKKFLRGRRFEDRVSVSLDQFKKEAESCGLKVVYETASHWGISPLWYIVVE